MLGKRTPGGWVKTEMKLTALVSGGLDSAVMLAYFKSRSGIEVELALSFDYGQRASKEVRCAARVAKHYGVEFQYRKIPLIPGSVLTDSVAEIPLDASKETRAEGVPPTWVPMRNLIFLSYAASFAVARRCDGVAYGAHATDAPYPDCKPRFVSAFRRVVQAAGGTTSFRVITPFLEFTKVDIVKRGLELQLPFELTYSCYKGGVTQCGRCDACLNRIEAFRANAEVDPAAYAIPINFGAE
jgi:7-cyano-7-deazaguanine synthase